MIQDVAQITMAGVLALMILREVFGFLRARQANGNGRPATTSIAKKGDLQPVVDRLDRLVELAKEQGEFSRGLKRMVEEIGETTDRQTRALDRLDSAIIKLQRRPTGPVNMPPETT